MAAIGQRPTDEDIAPVLRVLDHIHKNGGLFTKSAIARVDADAVAEAASRGWITTSVTTQPPTYGRRWLLTPAGLQSLTILRDYEFIT